MNLNMRPVSAVMLGVGVIVVLTALRQVSPEAVNPPLTAATAADRRTKTPTATRYVAGLGVIEPDNGEIDLAAQMPGVITAIHVKEGDTVRRGTVVAELANDDLKARLAQAQATLSIKTADLERLQNGPRRQEILQAEGQLREEEGALKLLRLQYDRRRALARQGAVPAETSDSAANALAAGRERRDSAEQSLLLLREGTRGEDLAAARGGVSLARHQVEEAEASLAKSYVRASSDGVVLRLYKEPGEAVFTDSSTPVAQIGDTSRLVVRTQIDEGDIAALRVGQAAEISADALAGQKLTGRITRISPRLGAKTITAGAPTEKRDARVLDVIVALDETTTLPINLRVDVFIDVESPPVVATPAVSEPAVKQQDTGTLDLGKLEIRQPAVSQPVVPQTDVTPEALGPIKDWTFRS